MNVETIQNILADNVLHPISQGLLIPTIALLIALLVYAVYTAASVLVEYFVERRQYQAAIPELISALGSCSRDQLSDAIQRCGLLAPHKEKLLTIVRYIDLSDELLADMTKRLLGDIKLGYQKRIGRGDVATKIAPMLGLMGTLVPLGPGIVALGQGDTSTLASSLTIAFDTTVAGLAVAVVCFIATKMRNRWYSDYLISLEAATNALLDIAAKFRADDNDDASASCDATTSADSAIGEAR